MKQLHVVHSIAMDFGGLGFAALRYAQSLALNGADVCLYVFDRSGMEWEANASYGAVKVHGGDGRGLISCASALMKFLKSHDFDVIHIHGTWTPLLALVGFIAFLNKKKFVISPHGCLEPHALKHRALKKKIALALYQGYIISRSSMLFATAKQELLSIRSLGITKPVAVIPNGVDIPDEKERLRGEDRIILFLSRIHPIKGLPDFINAWAMVRKPGWRVVIAGPDENNHLAELKGLISSLELSGDFDFPGLVSGEQKEKLFAMADLFILPTYSENFGIAIAEALARGVPVITTTGAPWEEIPVWRCGWWVQPGADSLANALNVAINTPRDELVLMGMRGIQMVKRKYAWEEIGSEAMRVYHWMLDNKLEAPASVDIVS